MKFKSLILALAFTVPAHAEITNPDLAKQLVKTIPGLTIDSLSPSPVDGVFEMISGKDVAYVSENGKYIFQGVLFDIEKRENLTEKKQGGSRAASLKKLPDDFLVKYHAAGKAKHILTIFTDPSCPFCRKLHDEIPKLNKLGVDVYYAMYAREGANSPVAQQIENAMCAKDRKSAIGKLMSGPVNPNESITRCPDGKTHDNMIKVAQVATEMGLEGTPFNVTANGRAFPGFRPAEEILKALEARN